MDARGVPRRVSSTARKRYSLAEQGERTEGTTNSAFSGPEQYLDDVGLTTARGFIHDILVNSPQPAHLKTGRKRHRYLSAWAKLLFERIWTRRGFADDGSFRTGGLCLWPRYRFRRRDLPTRIGATIKALKNAPVGLWRWQRRFALPATSAPKPRRQLPCHCSRIRRRRGTRGHCDFHARLQGFTGYNLYRQKVVPVRICAFRFWNTTGRAYATKDAMGKLDFSGITVRELDANYAP